MPSVPMIGLKLDLRIGKSAWLLLRMSYYYWGFRYTLQVVPNSTLLANEPSTLLCWKLFPEGI